MKQLTAIQVAERAAKLLGGEHVVRPLYGWLHRSGDRVSIGHSPDARAHALDRGWGDRADGAGYSGETETSMALPRLTAAIATEFLEQSRNTRSTQWLRRVREWSRGHR